MSRNRLYQRLALGLGVVALAGMGCSPITAIWALSGGLSNRKAPPDYPLPVKEGKKEITVAIVASASPTLMTDFAGVERELARLVGKRLMDDTKDDSYPITVVEPSKVEKAMRTPGRDWRTVSPAVIGQEVGADYVIDLTVNSMSMVPREFGGEIFQGQANLQVVVYDTAKPDHPFQQFPVNVMGVQKSATAVSPNYYRQMFVTKVATDLAWKHVPHLPEYGPGIQ